MQAFEDGLSPEQVLRMGLPELREIYWQQLCREMTRAEFIHILEECGALWLHSGDPKAPHAELTSGKCSDGFVDTLRALRHTNICQIMAYQLVKRYLSLRDGKVDWVVGSDHAGATLSFAVATILGAQHDFTEKGEGKAQIWKRFVIEPGETVPQVEELVTTTGTLQAVREGIRAGNPHPVAFVPVSLTLVHRSDALEFEGAPIAHGIHLDIKTWTPDECPLCKSGSERLRPKQNWARLTGRSS